MTEQLVLYPQATQLNLKNIANLLAVLKQAGLTGKKFNAPSTNSFTVGAKFINLISFLGCSPTINNPDGVTNADIEIILHKTDARFLSGKNTTPPACNYCKYKFVKWRELIEQWQDNHEIKITCPDCKSENLIPALNWHYRAAFSCCEIIINNISEGTALPADKLLATLKQYTKCDWHYFYRQL